MVAGKRYSCSHKTRITHVSMTNNNNNNNNNTTTYKAP